MENKNIFLVYKHTCPNNKVYIGITGRETTKRWGSNGNGYKNNLHFYNAIKKYEWKNIKHEILFENLTRKEAFLKEKELIKEYNSNNREYGYNNSLGGGIGPIGCKHSKEMNKKKSQYMKDHPNSGQFKKGIHPTTCFKKNRTPWNKGRKVTLKEIEKNRLSHLGKHSSVRTEFKPKTVLCIETNIIYLGTKEAGKQTKIPQTSISKACIDRQKTAGGYHWKYL